MLPPTRCMSMATRCTPRILKGAWAFGTRYRYVRFGPRFGPTGSGQTNTSRTRENSKKRDAFFSQDTQEIAVGDEPETIYMVTSGTHYNNECCFDYGNAEVSAKKRPPFLVQQLPA